MKYAIVDLKTTLMPYIPGGSFLGTRYDVCYEVEYWSWRKFKVVTETKHAFRAPVGICFRDSTTGKVLPTEIDEFITAYIETRNL